MSGTCLSSDQETTRAQPSMLQLEGEKKGLTLKGDSPGNKSLFCHLLHIMAGGSRKLVKLQVLPCKLDGCKITLHESLTRPEDMKKTSQKKLCVCVVEEALGTKVR
jgi:hypothetical protein